MASARGDQIVVEYPFAPVAQGIEHRFPKPRVASSNLAGGNDSNKSTTTLVRKRFLARTGPQTSAPLHDSERRWGNHVAVLKKAVPKPSGRRLGADAGGAKWSRGKTAARRDASRAVLGRGARLRDLPARSPRERDELERRCRASEGLPGRGGHRPALFDFLPGRSSSGGLARTRAGGGRDHRAVRG